MKAHVQRCSCTGKLGVLRCHGSTSNWKHFWLPHFSSLRVCYSLFVFMVVRSLVFVPSASALTFTYHLAQQERFEVNLQEASRASHRRVFCIPMAKTPRWSGQRPQISGAFRRCSSSGTSAEPVKASEERNAHSMRELLRFAVPALGISLAGPILSNIDNAFVGRLAGAEALASLSPGTVCADNVLYLLVFLPRATVGLVSRSYASGGAALAQKELVRVLCVALPVGLLLTLFYQTCTDRFLRVLHVAPALQGQAAAYVKVRGLVTWAALSQSCCLSALMATRDSITPLKVVAVAVVANLLGDFFLCAWPLRLGVVGAAAATALATLLGCSLMVRALLRQGLLPRSWQSWRSQLPRSLGELKPLLEYAGPLLIVIACRFLCLATLAFAAAALGTTSLAAYQVLVNLVTLFGLFGDPLSQTAQATLPPLLQQGKIAEARKAYKDLLALGVVGGLAIGALAAVTAYFGGSLFTSDPQVLEAVRQTAPAVVLAACTFVFAYPVDGGMLAAREFPCLIVLSAVGLVIQIPLLRAVVSAYAGTSMATRGLSPLVLTIAFRMVTLSAISLAWALRPHGPFWPRAPSR
ncbi:unnamed protein product [Polarella glacialis]|uniref:Protein DETOXIFICATION n=1 Tax=Polarella glacialis TaxID=89957 RepID=A0A813K368_POLGL|nr:unnamed protein product [Polarella glacialis]